MERNEFETFKRLLDSGDPHSASAYLEKLLANRPDDVSILHNMGFVHRLLGDFEQAERFYLRALEIEPKSISVLCALGIVYQQCKKWKLALDQFRQATQIDKLCWTAWNSAGHTYRMMGDDEKALEIYEHATEVAVGLATRELEKEHQLYSDEASGDGGKAMVVNTEVMNMLPLYLKRDETYARAMTQLGICCADLGDVERAVSVLTEAVEFLPPNSSFRDPIEALESLR